MQTYYAKLVDKLIHPKLEKRFGFGRRHVEDRRRCRKDRRSHAEDSFRYGQSERRDLKKNRRSPGLEDRRKRWFRINAFQSRHFSWSPESERDDKG